MPSPEILVIAPPAIIHPQGAIANKFEGAEKRCAGLATELEKVAREHAVHFFDAGRVTEASRVDGIHLDEDQHMALGNALAENVLRILAGA